MTPMDLQKQIGNSTLIISKYKTYNTLSTVF